MTAPLNRFFVAMAIAIGAIGFSQCSQSDGSNPAAPSAGAPAASNVEEHAGDDGHTTDGHTDPETHPEDPHDPHDPEDPHDPHDPEDPHDPHDPDDPHDPHDPEDPHDPDPTGDEGCTPGFWRNHTANWVGYSTGADFDATFGVDFFNPNITLLQAAGLGGGGVDALARHGVAGLLSAASPDVAYAYTQAQVLDIVQGDGAYTGMSVSDRTNLLVAANEAGCPL